MKTTILRLAGVMAVALALPLVVSGLVTAGPMSLASPGAGPMAWPAGSSAASPVAGVEVAIVDYGFDASTIEVKAGTTVTWINTGGVLHTTTSTDGLWDSRILRTGESFSYTFTTPGTYEYQCALHTVMKGIVVVKP